LNNILFFSRPLGDLSWIRIWHDNSGRDEMASWFLKYVIVHDLQTRDKFYFICERWLGVEYDDGLIDRLVPICLDKQKFDLKYFTLKHTKFNMSDSHMWYSIFTRPMKSTYTRTDRVTCAFVLLYITMLLSILYYGTVDNSLTKSTINLFGIGLSPEQVQVGVIINLFTIPPVLLVIELFRRSRKRFPRKILLKKAIDDHLELKSGSSRPQVESNDRRESRKLTRKEIERQHNLNKNVFKRIWIELVEFSLPWWFKIFAYALSWSIMFVCNIFILFKGLEYGNEQTASWLKSIIFSLITSVFITEPLKVNSMRITKFSILFLKTINFVSFFLLDIFDFVLFCFNLSRSRRRTRH
jgi:polycystin 1L2